MEELFDLTSNTGAIITWRDRAPAVFSGLILPNAQLSSVNIGVGDMMFQHVHRPLFNTWKSDYQMHQNVMTHSRLDYASIELSMLVRNAISYQLKPFGHIRHREMELNLINSLSMDSKVKFEKDVLYSTLDVHYGTEALEILMKYIPELVSPFLNDHYAKRERLLFSNHIFSNRPIASMIQIFYYLIERPAYYPLLLDISGILLLALVFLWHAEVTQRRGLNDRQTEIRNSMNVVHQYLVNHSKLFEGIHSYAQMANMSDTAFKKNFVNEFGVTPFQLWEKERLHAAVDMLIGTDDLIKEIAYIVGFGDAQAMDKAFRKFFKETPSDFRNRYKAG